MYAELVTVLFVYETVRLGPFFGRSINARLIFYESIFFLFFGNIFLSDNKHLSSSYAGDARAETNVSLHVSSVRFNQSWNMSTEVSGTPQNQIS
jgi:hypothetical protein